MLSPLKSPLERDAPILGHEFLHANNHPLLFPTSTSLLLIKRLNIVLSLKSLLLQTLWSMVTYQGRKTFYKLISATILMENMLKTHKAKGGTLPSDGTECLQV
jgi:hypothetical protein